MRLVFNLLLAAAVALITGLGLSYFALNEGPLFGANQLGPWLSWPDVGGTNPNPYTRAYLARRGALQPGRSEGIQFKAEADSAGRRLDVSCTYLVAGKTPIASFWTLVALDAAGRNLAREGTPLYLDSMHLSRAADGSVKIYVSPRLSTGDWLETVGKGHFALQLTLYDVPDISSFGPEVLAMPTITREACL